GVESFTNQRKSPPFRWNQICCTLRRDRDQRLSWQSRFEGRALWPGGWCGEHHLCELMKMIQPNCRIQFAAEDIEFIVSVLGGKLGTAECLVKLLADEESRDLILDDEALLHALLERRGCLRVSTRFYFYILVRHVFRRSDLEDRTVADYVSEVLAEFAGAERARCLIPGQTGPLDYFF